MIDVHILVMDYTRPEWLAQCIKSVVVAAENAPFAVDVHVQAGVIGHLGRARKAGYARGLHPYVTHVDDDDFVDQDAFSILAETLRAKPEAITTGERHLHAASGKSYENQFSKHHLAVYRRDVLESSDYADFVYHPDQRALSQVTPVHLPFCVYNCRIYMDSGSRVQRRENPAAAMHEREAIKNPTLFVAEAYTSAQIAALMELP